MASSDRLEPAWPIVPSRRELHERRDQLDDAVRGRARRLQRTSSIASSTEASISTTPPNPGGSLHPAVRTPAMDHPQLAPRRRVPRDQPNARHRQLGPRPDPPQGTRRHLPGACGAGRRQLASGRSVRDRQRRPNVAGPGSSRVARSRCSVPQRPHHLVDRAPWHCRPRVGCSVRRSPHTSSDHHRKCRRRPSPDSSDDVNRSRLVVEHTFAYNFRSWNPAKQT